MKKRNKKYKPREVLPVPLMFRHSTDGQIGLKLQPRMAFQRLKEGEGTEQDLDTLAFRLNWGFVAQRDFYANQVEALAQDGLDAVHGAKARLERLGKIGLSGIEMMAIAHGLDLADRMGDELTRKENLQACETVMAWNAKALRLQALAV